MLYVGALKKLTTIHPTDITPGPPVFKPYWKRLYRADQSREWWHSGYETSYVVKPVMTLYR